MAIARYPTVVLDCPDAQALATFYGTLLEWDVVQADTDWWSARSDYGHSLEFQQVADYRAPEWPGQERPQQMHIDVVVEDLEEAERAVVALGATRHAHQPGESFRVFLDPAGHPFCLCLN